MHSTAFDALETSFNVKVDQSSVKFPNLKFKGVFRPTVIRKPLKNNQAETPSATQAETPAFAKPAEVDLDPITPQHSIRYRSAADLQDHLIQPTNIALSNRPKELVVEVDLPLLGSAAGIDLDVQVFLGLCIKYKSYNVPIMYTVICTVFCTVRCTL